MNKILNFLKKRKYLSVIVLVLLIILGIFVFNKNKTNGSTIVAHTGDFTNDISVSGKVVASSDVSLGFSQGGRISSVRTNVGNVVSTGMVLASVENGDLQADLAQKEANLEREQSKLIALQLGTRLEQVAITESALAGAQTTLNQAKQSVINAISDAYTKSDDAVKNKVDQFFQNPLTNNPTIILFINDASSLILGVNTDRASVGKMLDSWENSVSKINSDTDLDKAIQEAGENLEQLKLFLAKVSIITNNKDVTYNGGNSIPALWKSDTSTARLAIDSAITSLSTIVTSYKSAKADLVTKENSLKLEQAGATKEDIDAQISQVKGALASVNSSKAILAKTLIVAPFNGIITKIDAKVGEVASPNASLVQMMSVGTFQIESYVPEVSIALIKLNDEAKITLDAYGESVLFNAKVVSIDPAETIKDGVSTYKIKLQFSDIDQRIKSGMTANVSIITFSKKDVIVLPGGVVFEKDSKKFVQVKVDDKIINREVIIGNVSSLGQVEIISGVSDGDEIVLDPVVK